nr:MAG TPA: hypothetical protein [Crassvirales sp.]
MINCASSLCDLYYQTFIRTLPHTHFIWLLIARSICILLVIHKLTKSRLERNF